MTTVFVLLSIVRHDGTDHFWPKKVFASLPDAEQYVKDNPTGWGVTRWVIEPCEFHPNFPAGTVGDN